MCVMQCVGRTGIAIVVMRLYIRWAARKQDTVKMREHAVNVEIVGQRGNEQWQSIRSIDERAKIFLSGHMKWMVTDLSPVSRNSDHGL